MVPELFPLGTPNSLLRIPPQLDVPLTPRVRAIIDSPPLRRLARVSQLGLVSLVYPGAGHSRLEHSLGVYRNALQVLQHLMSDSRFTALVAPVDVEAFLLASLLHDCGHWPFCHPLEDMALDEIPRHEPRARSLLEGDDLAPLIRRDWSCDVTQIMQILTKRPESAGQRFLSTLLSGPIDIDKMDYLVRDSLHAGVPYGRNFDQSRLLSAFQIHPHEPRLAIGEKGRTAAEMMVFARYVMFSEVYWHHAVRSATAMLQRAVYLLRGELRLEAMYDLGDEGWIERLRRAALKTAAEPLAEGLFGPRRRLYKRVAQFNRLDQPEWHRALAHRPYPYLAKVSQLLADKLAKRLGRSVSLAEVIIDAPPQKLEVDINMDVVDRAGRVRTLGEVSPVVDCLAHRQFDSHVKRVRVFVPPEIREKLPDGQLPPEDVREVLADLREISAENLP